MPRVADARWGSGRLDHQTYFKCIEVERSEIEAAALDRILMSWFDEAVLVGIIPDGIGPLDGLPHAWHWDGRAHVDPAKEAKGQQTRLANGTTHRGREYAREGLDVDKEDAKAAESFGLTVPEYRARLAGKLLGKAREPVEVE